MTYALSRQRRADTRRLSVSSETLARLAGQGEGEGAQR